MPRSVGLPLATEPVLIVQKAVWDSEPLLTARKISPPTGFRSTVRWANSESLYRLSYSGCLSIGIASSIVLFNDTHFFRLCSVDVSLKYECGPFLE
jgi:hypothetical protein